MRRYVSIKQLYGKIDFSVFSILGGEPVAGPHEKNLLHNPKCGGGGMLFLKHATGAAVCFVGAAARRVSIAAEHLATASIHLIIIMPCVYGIILC